MIILLVNRQVGTIGDDVPQGCRRRCRSGRVIAGRLESIAELMCMTLLRVVVCLAIAALVTLVRFGFPRSISVWFHGVLRLVSKLVDLTRARVKSYAIRGDVCGT